MAIKSFRIFSNRSSFLLKYLFPISRVYSISNTAIPAAMGVAVDVPSFRMYKSGSLMSDDVSAEDDSVTLLSDDGSKQVDFAPLTPSPNALYFSMPS